MMTGKAVFRNCKCSSVQKCSIKCSLAESLVAQGFEGCA